jgi:hypothetical protein
LVIYALLAVAFFTMAAVVLDIAALRQGRRADRTAADLAVTAGVTELVVEDPSTFMDACEAAWGYALANRTEGSGAMAAPDCVGAFPSVACDPGVPRTAVGTMGPVRIEITHPVPDGSPLMLAEAQGGDVAQTIEPIDGGACERLGVRVVRSRTFLFSQIVGMFGGSTDVHSVARALTTSSTTESPGLVALERTGCNGAFTTGGGRLDVQGIGQSGLVVVDSDASACAAGFAIDPDPGGRIRALPNGAAPGLISSFALAGTNFARAYDPADTGGGSLSPVPSPALARTGRAIIDNRYNGLPPNDFIDQLEAALGGPAPPAAHVPYPDPSCVVLPAAALTVNGDTFVDCPVLDVQGALTFSASSVVFAGSVIVRDGGCLAMNDTTCGGVGLPSQDGVVFVRGGLTKESNGQLHLVRSLVWLGGALDVILDPNPSGSGGLRWTAPLAGRFEDLLLWAEAPLPMRLARQEVLLVEGTAFTPNATFTLEAQNPRSLTAALQVVALRVEATGSGDVTLVAAAGRSTGRLTRQVRLIR